VHVSLGNGHSLPSLLPKGNSKGTHNTTRQQWRLCLDLGLFSTWHSCSSTLLLFYTKRDSWREVSISSNLTIKVHHDDDLGAVGLAYSSQAMVQDPNSIKFKIVQLIFAMRTLLRCKVFVDAVLLSTQCCLVPLMILNILVIVYELILG
jgi:Yos1-like